MAIEIVCLPLNMVIFHDYIIWIYMVVYQRVPNIGKDAQ